MKRLVFLLLFLAICGYIGKTSSTTSVIEGFSEHCKDTTNLEPRPHSVSILEFGAVGDGETLNTIAFQNAIFYLKSFADKGGAQLYVPSGKWLTSSFNLTSHLTLFLDRDATILAFQDHTYWEVDENLPSYGLESEHGRYRSLINGQNLTDVVITGDNGTIDGQGWLWWKQFNSGCLNYSRPHLVEFVGSSNITITNLTFLNSPAWHIHPVYCSNVQVQNITAYAPPESPLTSGVVPDSSEYVCIANSNITTAHDAIALKSGWDKFGISYGRPTKNIHIRKLKLQSYSGSGLALGSEMSGGISNIIADQLHIHDSNIGINLKTTRGRGGYMKDIVVSDVEMENVNSAISASGHCGIHPNDKFDPNALPVVSDVTFKDIVGTNVTISGNFSGIHESPFTSICLSNITFTAVSESSTSSWVCSNVMGFFQNVSPEPCLDFQSSFLNSSSSCFSLLHHSSSSAAFSMR